MKIICITGIDGAGKTTQAKSAVVSLRKAGISAVYLYGRTYPVISRWMMALGKITLLRRFSIKQDYQVYHREKKSIMRRPLLKWFYTSAIYIDYYIQIWIKLLPQFLQKNVIILDRYIYDTVISDLAVHLNYSLDETRQAIQRGFRFLPLPAKTIFIDLPEDIAFARKNDVVHVDYLSERRCFYQILKDRSEVVVLDGTVPLEQISRSVLEILTTTVLGD